MAPCLEMELNVHQLNIFSTHPNSDIGEKILTSSFDQSKELLLSMIKEERNPKIVTLATDIAKEAVY